MWNGWLYSTYASFSHPERWQKKGNLFESLKRMMKLFPNLFLIRALSVKWRFNKTAATEWSQNIFYTIYFPPWAAFTLIRFPVSLASLPFCHQVIPFFIWQSLPFTIPITISHLPNIPVFNQRWNFFQFD